MLVYIYLIIWIKIIPTFTNSNFYKTGRCDKHVMNVYIYVILQLISKIQSTVALNNKVKCRQHKIQNVKYKYYIQIIMCSSMRHLSTWSDLIEKYVSYRKNKIYGN